MFVLIRLTQHVSGIITPIIRRTDWHLVGSFLSSINDARSHDPKVNRIHCCVSTATMVKRTRHDYTLHCLSCFSRNVRGQISHLHIQYSCRITFLYNLPLYSEVARRVFGPKRDEVTGEWRKLHNEKLNDLYCSPNIVGVTKSR